MEPRPSLVLTLGLARVNVSCPVGLNRGEQTLLIWVPTTGVVALLVDFPVTQGLGQRLASVSLLRPFPGPALQGQYGAPISHSVWVGSP